MDNSDNLIYYLNVDKITRDDESIGKRLNKFSDESKISPNRLDTDTLKSYVQGEDIQECTPSTNWTSNKSKKLLNRLSLDDTLVNPFCNERWNHTFGKDSTEVTVEKESRQKIEQLSSLTVTESVQSDHDEEKHQELMVWRPQ